MENETSPGAQAPIPPATPKTGPETLPGNQSGATPADRHAGDKWNNGDKVHLEYVAGVLEDAERLLRYAAGTGVEIDSGVRDNVLRARAVGPAGWDEKAVADLLTSLTQLAAKLKPVTAESLKAYCEKRDTNPTFRLYRNVSVCIGIIIVIFSTVSFLTTAISNSISGDITNANTLAAKLRAELGAPTNAPHADMSQPPPGYTAIDVITDLQQYASTIRAINVRARKLNWFVNPVGSFERRGGLTNTDLELPVGLTNLWVAANGRTEAYQKVRSFAQNIIDNVSFTYGAIASGILPVLYALFGACAYLLRNFEQQMATRTFIPSPANSARFLIAGIGGTVVGLFNFTITQQATVPPLATAFLVGYGVDLFFAFLENLLHTFTKKTPNG